MDVHRACAPTLLHCGLCGERVEAVGALRAGPTYQFILISSGGFVGEFCVLQ